MNASNNYILFPSELERPALFRLLQEASSLSIWTVIGDYYKAWVDVTKRVYPLVQQAGHGGDPAMIESELRGILSGYAAMQGALSALAAGDKSVFRWLGYGSGGPYFCEAYREISAWRTRYWREAEATLPLQSTIYWDEWDTAFKDLTSAWDHGFKALEPRHTDVPAVVETMYYLRGLASDELGNKLPPDPNWVALMQQVETLPPVSQPYDEVLVKTGALIPCFGIWEPVKAEMGGGFAGLFKRPMVTSDRKYELDGCMNYLHAGSPAPTVAFEEDDVRQSGRPTVWRLLWRDDRYLDGTIPEVERDYLFVARRHDSPASIKTKNIVADDLVWRDSGMPAPLAGRWASRDDLGKHVICNKGDALPQLNGRETIWVHVPRV